MPKKPRFVTLLNGTFINGSTYLQKLSPCTGEQKDAIFDKDSVILGYLIQPLANLTGIFVTLQLILQEGGGIVPVVVNADLSQIGTYTPFLYVPFTSYGIQVTTTAPVPPSVGQFQVTLLIGNRCSAVSEHVTTGTALTFLKCESEPCESKSKEKEKHSKKKCDDC